MDSVRMFWIGVELWLDIWDNFFFSSLFVVFLVVFFGFLLIFCKGFNQPKLVLALVDVILQYLLPIFSLSPADI